MHIILFAAMCLIWGATWVALKFALATVPPLLLGGTRLVAAGALLTLYLWLRGESARIDRADVARLISSAILMMVATYALLFWGSIHVSSGLSAVLNLATIPIALLSIGLLANEETVDVRKGIALVLGTTGLTALFASRLETAVPGSTLELIGALAVTGSAIAYAWGSVVARPLLRRYPSVQISALTTLIGGCLLTLLSLASEPGAVAALRGQWGLMAWLGWLFLVLFGSLCAFTIYMRLLRDWGPTGAGTYAFVSPIIAIWLGALVFDEHVTPVEGVGMAAMLGGAALSLLGRLQRQPAKA